ncbi:MAG TPA: hypothetical protein VNA57_09745 [Acidimicrobiales bacterium]|nr:hypothetical protein [Acidimicrobiales bacterium]
MTSPDAGPGPPSAAPAGPKDPEAGSWSGRRIVQWSWGGTLAFVATAGLATVSGPTDLVALVVALGLFAAGTAAFTAAFVIAVRRSRTEQILVPSLFFLQGSAPAPVRRRLFASLAIEVVVAFVTAAVRPNTSLAFGILAPMYGLGLAGLWAARHGEFPLRPRSAEERRRLPVRPDQAPGYHRPSESD